MYPNSNSKLLGLHWFVTDKVTEPLFYPHYNWCVTCFILARF